MDVVSQPLTSARTDTKPNIEAAFEYLDRMNNEYDREGFVMILYRVRGRARSALPQILAEATQQIPIERLGSRDVKPTQVCTVLKEVRASLSDSRIPRR